jgi:antitoxin component of MazEF toxin-antitoxin module
MLVEATLKRIGGSIFARLPPEIVRTLGLRPGDRITVEVRPVEGTVADVLALRGKHKELPPFDRAELWGRYGER